MATPTTYFSRYFKEAVGKYTADSLHMTIYSKKNLASVRSAASAFESQGIDWNTEMIAAKTGLSQKVVRKTFEADCRSHYTQIDGNASLRTTSGTYYPENYVVKKEQKELLSSAVRNCLTDVEIQFLLDRLEGGQTYNGSARGLSYRELAERYGLQSAKCARNMYNRVLKKLCESNELRHYQE